MSDHKLLSAVLRPFFRKGTGARFSLPDCVRDDSRLLCIDAGCLSDVLFHMPLLTAIRRRYPGAVMDFLMPEKHATLVVPSGLARQCLLYKPAQLNLWRPAFAALLRQVQAGDYDLAFLMAHEAQPALEMAALASGAALRFGPSHPQGWPAINFELRASPDSYLGDRLRHAAPLFGFAAADLAPRWPLPMDKLRQMAQQVHFHKPNPRQILVGVDPGADLTGPGWPLETFQAVARALTARIECRVLPLGHPEEREQQARLEVLLSAAPAGLNRDTLLEVVLLLSQCDLFVAGNTDCLHFAVAMGVPAVGLFRADVPGFWRPPAGPRLRLLEPDAEGRLDVDELLAAVEAVAGDRRRAAGATVVAAGPAAAAPEPGSPDAGGAPIGTPPAGARDAAQP
ncbi:glycosyltransferase family 9 protein [bacterium]|nr:glycosyltransferase family 9 protein [bacterium]